MPNFLPHPVRAAQLHDRPIDGFVRPGKGAMGGPEHLEPPFADLIFDRTAYSARMQGNAYVYAGRMRYISTSSRQYPAASGNIQGRI
jgi:hypothetical protein